jgi:quercetin dioxygenase-like cupin family protein
MLMNFTRLALLSVFAVALNAAADTPKAAAPVRTLLERHDQSGVPGTEIVLGTAMLPAGSGFPYHTHPGDEIGYVMKGSVILQTRGQPDRTLKAGDSFFNPRGAVHTLITTPGGDGGTVVSTWIVDKGQPLATPVP